MADKIRIGLIGCGFMGRTHSNAFAQAPKFFKLPYRPVLKLACARNAERAQTFAANWGYEGFETDWRSVVHSPEIDLVDIATPNDTHAEIALEAARAGKMVMCEKPLGRTVKESESMVQAVEEAKVPNMVWYNYRRAPAVVLAKNLIDAGKLGKNLSLPHRLPSGLDDFGRSPAGWRGTLAIGRQRRRKRRNG